MVVSYHEVKKLLMTQQNGHMKISTLKVQSSEQVVLRQSRGDTSSTAPNASRELTYSKSSVS